MLTRLLVWMLLPLVAPPTPADFAHHPFYVIDVPSSTLTRLLVWMLLPLVAPPTPGDF